jgi:hypothetical protein
VVRSSRGRWCRSRKGTRGGPPAAPGSAHGRHIRLPQDDHDLLQELPGVAPCLMRGIQLPLPPLSGAAREDGDGLEYRMKGLIG